MDYLREGIHLRGFAQIEPLVAYKNEAFELFRDLMNTIWGDFARMIFHVEVTVAPEDGGAPAPPAPRRAAPGSSTGGRNVTYSGGGMAQPSALAMAAANAGAGPVPGSAEGYAGDEEPPIAPPVEQRRVSADEQIGRNDPCWCGSGKKFKKCHGQ
jgi:preprotein translocase subunit SecA